jgi:hypothetical protein
MGLESAYNATGTIIDVISDAQRRYTNVEIKRSLFYLLTVGSAVHSLFDMLIWYLMACFCFRPGGGFKVTIFLYNIIFHQTGCIIYEKRRVGLARCTRCMQH